MKRFLSVFSALVLVFGFGLAGCSDDDSSSGGQGAEFDATLYYTKAELDDGALDARYYTESEIDSDFYTVAEVDGLMPSFDNTALFLDGYDDGGAAQTHGWVTRTDDQSNGTSSPYAGWTIPANAKKCLFEIKISNCAAAENVDIYWATETAGHDLDQIVAMLTIDNAFFEYSVQYYLLNVENIQGKTLLAYIGNGTDPGITYTNPIQIMPAVYFK